MPGRGHALIIDSGWRDVAATALESFAASPTRNPQRLPHGPAGSPTTRVEGFPALGSLPIRETSRIPSRSLRPGLHEATVGDR